MAHIKTYWQFYGSILLGILIWVFTFAVLPVHVVEPFKLKTFVFIFLSYAMLMAGFNAFNFKTKSFQFQYKSSNKIIKILLIVIVISFLLRWYDLFVIRGLSFANEVRYNREINDLNFEKFGLLFIFASIFKGISFFPYILCVSTKLKPKKILVTLSYLCLFLPIIEAILKGSRKPMFDIFVVVIFTFMFFYKKLNLKKVFAMVIVFAVLMTLSMSMLIKREIKLTDFNDTFYSMILESRYNELLKPKECVKSFLEDDKISDSQKFYAFTFLHTGQYITHGVFEFNHIIDYENLPITNGKYIFSTVIKFLNKTKLFNEIVNKNPSPREYVYLTAFGVLYIDFRWFTVAFMFILGVAQKYLFQKSKQSFIYMPILIYFLIFNVFLLVINYLDNAGLYPIVSFMILLSILYIFNKNTYEKSTGS